MGDGNYVIAQNIKTGYTRLVHMECMEDMMNAQSMNPDE